MTICFFPPAREISASTVWLPAVLSVTDVPVTSVSSKYHLTPLSVLPAGTFSSRAKVPPFVYTPLPGFLML